MSWRTVVITNRCKLSYKNNYLIIKNEELQMIHLSEIYCLVVDSTAVSLSSYLLSEMMKNKIKIIFCDEKRLPQGELIPYYGSHNSSKKIRNQIEWESEDKIFIWTEIIRQKIKNQFYLLDKLSLDVGNFPNYIRDLQFADTTNREGHAAKVYFNQLFGKDFTRNQENDINIALNYGYSILLAAFTKEITSLGFLTQLGFMHKNEYNSFNLSSDLMEPFRMAVDELVFLNQDKIFDSNYKLLLIDILNNKYNFNGSNQYLTNIISIYTKSVFDAIQNNDYEILKNFEYHEL